MSANTTVQKKTMEAIVQKGYGAPERELDLDRCLRVLLEVLRLCSVLCVPFMPAKSSEMRKQLGLPADVASLRLEEASRPGADDWHTVNKPVPLFPRLEIPADE